MVRVFFCEFYKIFKNTFFTERLRTTAFVQNKETVNILALQILGIVCF